MGEYYLKCEPLETKAKLKEVLNFLDNPLFTNSIINTGFMKYISMLIGLILTIFLGYKTYNYFLSYLNGRDYFSWVILWGVFTTISLIVTIMFFSDIIKI